MNKKVIQPAVPATPSPKGGFRQTDRADVPEDSLSFREKKVLQILRASSEPLSVRGLARRAFPGMRSKPGLYETVRTDGSKVRHGTGAAYRCALNSLRRLVVGGHVERVGRGLYTATSPAASPRTS